MAVGALALAVEAGAKARSPARREPDYAAAIPVAFRGHWDELQSDKCRDREPRYALGARDFSEFEVFWDVTRVKRYSPTEIDIYTSLRDERGRLVREVWRFKLVDGGKGLTHRGSNGEVFRRCPPDSSGE